MSQSIVIYKRLSTTKERQTSSFATQDDYIGLYLDQYAPNSTVIASFEEELSGTDSTRPMLRQALDLCQQHNAILLVAKLDRLGRDVELIAAVIKRVTLKVATMPQADNFQLHIYAALAEQEVAMIRQRIKDGLQKAKERGSKVGHPDAATHMRKTVQPASGTACRARTRAVAAKANRIISDGKALGRPLWAIRDTLNQYLVPTRNGKPWTVMTVSRYARRIDAGLLEARTA